MDALGWLIVVVLAGLSIALIVGIIGLWVLLVGGRASREDDAPPVEHHAPPPPATTQQSRYRSRFRY